MPRQWSRQRCNFVLVPSPVLLHLNRPTALAEQAALWLDQADRISSVGCIPCTETTHARKSCGFEFGLGQHQDCRLIQQTVYTHRSALFASLVFALRYS